MMNEPIELRVRQVAADVLNIPLAEVTRETSPASTAGWDSVQNLTFVLALEQAFAVQFEPEDIDEMRSIGNAIDLIAAKNDIP